MSAPAFPQLIDVATGKRYSLGGVSSFLVGRSEHANICVPNPTCSREHFRIVNVGQQYFVEPLNAKNPTYLNGQPVVGRTPLPHNAVLRAGENDFLFESVTTAPPPGEEFATQMATDKQLETIRKPEFKGRFRVKESMLIGREVGADIQLPHPQVSRQHAEIVAKSGGVSLRDLGSANGTFVNGRRLTKRAVWLAEDDLINIGPYALIYAKGELWSGAGENELALELVADEVSKIVTDRQTGKKLKLLDGVTLVFKPREFVCLLGPSGSGKSTLMTILSGRGLPDKGRVLVNGQDLHANFDALKQDLALVPQKDVLHDSLTVGQALGYTSRLRLPPDTSRDEAEDCIADILETVALTHRRGTVIRMLSGGQVKRACLANEILCKPNLLFLDEVTSGLDERTDSDMMDLFRQIAHDGKTVVCITHSLSNVERTCDLVVLLTPGGKLAFVGTPAEARDYFGIGRLGEVYALLEDKKHPPEEWQERFLESEYYAKYVTDRLPHGRRQEAELVDQPAQGLGKRVGTFVRQASVLTRRYFAIWRRDTSSLLAMAGQSLVVALLLVVVFGDLSEMEFKDKVPRSVNLLFLLAVSSFWFGCNNAAKEIVKERTIFVRECDFNLMPSSYYASKLLVLWSFSFVQTLLLFGVTTAFCHPPGSFASQLAVLLTLAAAGTALGLLISTLAPSEEMAITLIPMVVIPQIILSGTIAPLSGLGKGLAASCVTTYWGKKGLDALLPSDIAEVARDMKIAEDGSFIASIAVLAAHTIAFILITLLVMALRGRSATMKLHNLRKVITHG